MKCSELINYIKNHKLYDLVLRVIDPDTNRLKDVDKISHSEDMVYLNLDSWGNVTPLNIKFDDMPLDEALEFRDAIMKHLNFMGYNL